MNLCKSTVTRKSRDTTWVISCWSTFSSTVCFPSVHPLWHSPSHAGVSVLVSCGGIAKPKSFVSAALASVWRILWQIKHPNNLIVFIKWDMFYEFLFLTTSTRYIPMLCISALYLLSTAVTFTIKRRILLSVSKYRMAVNKMAPPMAGVVEKNSPTKSKKSSKRKVDDSRNEDKVTGKNTPNKKSKSNFTDLDFKVQLRDPNTSFSGKHGKTRGSWAFEFRDRFHVELSELLTSSTQFLLEIHNIPAFFTSIRDKLASWIYLNVTRLLGFIAPGFATRPVQAILPPRTPDIIAHWQVAPPARPPSRWLPHMILTEPCCSFPDIPNMGWHNKRYFNIT